MLSLTECRPYFVHEQQVPANVDVIVEEFRVRSKDQYVFDLRIDEVSLRR